MRKKLGQNYEYDKGNDWLEQDSKDYVELGLNCCVEFIDEKLSHLNIEKHQRKIKVIWTLKIINEKLSQLDMKNHH